MTSLSQVYEYCKVDTECVKGTRRYDSAKCDVQFNWRSPSGDGYTTYNECVQLETPTVRGDTSKMFGYMMRGQTYFRL